MNYSWTSLEIWQTGRNQETETERDHLWSIEYVCAPFNFLGRHDTQILLSSLHTCLHSSISTGVHHNLFNQHAPPPTPTPPPFTMKWQRWQPQIRLDLTTIPITYSRREKQQRCVGVESSNRYGGGYVYIQWSRGEGSRSRKVGRLIIFVEPHKVYGH